MRSQYASYEAELLNGTLLLARQHHIKLEGTIAWAFTFPGQPPFAGLRAFTTDEIDLPLMNAFRMFGLLRGERAAVSGSAALAVRDVLRSSVRTEADVNAIATFKSDRVEVLVWNYHDESDRSAPATIHLRVEGLPQGLSRVLLEHWGVDQNHSNAYTAWQRMGSPRTPSASEQDRLEAAGQLQLSESPRWVRVEGKAVEITFSQPALGLSLLDFTW